MEYPFSYREKGNCYWVPQRVEGGDQPGGNIRNSLSEDPFYFSELMNLDNAGWCSSTAATNQMFASFGFCSFPSMLLASFDSLNVTGKSSGTFVESDDALSEMDSSYYSADRTVFRQTDAHFGNPLDFTGVELGVKPHHNGNTQSEQKPGSFPGLPGRVFISRVPEWTSNVIHYKLVTTKEKINFDSEMDHVCRAFKVVNLRTLARPQFLLQCLSRNQRAALAEITDVLRVMCHVHSLPLALTWIPCNYTVKAEDEFIKMRVRESDKAWDGKCVLCIEDTAYYINDIEKQDFVHACIEHYLEDGQGIAGKALQSNHSFFSTDVKTYDVSDYPLVHHASKFNLNAAVAIRLRSTYTDDNDYILELFLPINMKGSSEQQLLLNNLSGTMQRILSLSQMTSEMALSADGDMNSSHSTPLNESYSSHAKGADGPPEKAINGLFRQKRSTAEKNVSFSVLQQYLSGSLNDAAKSIGGVGGLKFDPATGEFVAAGAIIQEHNPEKTLLCSNKNLPKGLSKANGEAARSLLIPSICEEVKKTSYSEESKSVALDAGSFPASSVGAVSWTCPENATMGLFFRQGDNKGNKKVEIPDCHFMSRSSSSSSGPDEMDSRKQGDDEIVEYNDQPASSNMTSKITVKATYKEYTARFKFEPSAVCFQLYEQVAKRFKIQNGTFRLNYLDEEEWVTLISDSDLLECLEMLEYVGSRSVKFQLRDVPCAMGSSSNSSCFLP
ncbi:Plant regulator RWP-RK family protein, putative isoform 2 [Hibiscus syriacus]|uniref:Plant regulator RWP-RK family protein, putative isoform 2 n=1 Tax=Hibiscus syriacus TaxID=106335 RepID=A0A6A3AJJ8_HIBSY|nr:Plant regulator RWP-RK family protein, putative isoform 2 [Hibiscus syriacus]